MVSQKLESIKAASLTLLAECLSANNVPESHGIGHALKVMKHCQQAIESHERSAPEENKLGETTKLSLILAALLHDADDRKYFPPDSNNAKRICETSCQPFMEQKELVAFTQEVLNMISYVSTSKNGTSIPAKAKECPYLLWPRFSDRLVAIGISGAVRCWQFSMEKNEPLALPSTPRPTDHAAVWEHVTLKRFKEYQQNGKSQSMFDHYYDKLLQIPAAFTMEVVHNYYLVGTAKSRVEPLLDLCVEYGRTGEIPIEQFKKLAQSCS